MPVALFVLAVLAASIWLPFEYRNGINNSLIGIILALSLVVVTGFVGQVSLAQVALSGIAAFGLGSYVAEAGIPFILGYPMAIATAALFGLGVGVSGAAVERPEPGHHHPRRGDRDRGRPLPP